MDKGAWLSQLPPGTPDRFTPADGAWQADAVLGAAVELLRAIRMSYAGTLPPPPWPSTPSLQAAREQVGKIRDGFEVLDRRGVKKLTPKAAANLRARLAADGAAVFDSMAALERDWKSGKTLQKYVADIWNLGTSGPLLLLAGLLYFERRR